jgi:hypothetical protein
MSGIAKMTTSERLAAIQKKEQGMLQALHSESEKRIEQSARLRELRLAKEAQEAAGKLALNALRMKTKGFMKRRRAPPRVA